jgi:FkbM family methyltransferase
VQRIIQPDNNVAVRRFLASRRGVLAFDIGANIGQSAKVLAPNFARVISLEPARESFELLKAECAPNVQPFELAAGARIGRTSLYECENSGESGQLVYGPGLNWGSIVGQRDVLTTTLDTLAETHGLPDFVKVDVEGSEVAVMQGSLDLLKGLPESWLVEIHHSSHEQPVRKALRDYQVTRHVHEHLPVGDPTRTNHLYLVAVL